MKFSKVIKRIPVVILYLIILAAVIELTLRFLSIFYSRTPAIEAFNDNIFTVVCMGDSFTYGLGVRDLDTYPAQLERLLNDAQLYGKKYRVYNLGVPGMNSSQVLNYARDIIAARSAPQLLCVLIGANDSWNLAATNIDKVIDETATVPKFLSIKKALADLRIYKFMKLLTLNLKGKPPESAADPFKVIAAYENIDAHLLRRLLRYNLSRIIALARTHGTEVILLNYPRGDVYGKGTTKEVADEYSVPFINCSALFNEQLQSRDYNDLFLYDISHPNNRGYRLMADAVYRVIEELFDPETTTP